MRVPSTKLNQISRDLRKIILKSISKAKNGHPGGSLSVLDIILELYVNHMKHDVARPKWADRDRFVLSKGHGVPALYAVLAHCGYFSLGELENLRVLGSPLQGHPANRLLAPIEASTGSLGQGLSVALGMALAARIKNKHKPSFNVYTVLGDGEVQEGQVWEAAMSAAHYKVGNLIAFVDRNKGQIDGLVDHVMTIEPLEERFSSFGWQVLKINGHNYDEINKACELGRQEEHKPTMILAQTIKGKGVSFLEEDTVGWHGKALSENQLEQAITELGE